MCHLGWDPGCQQEGEGATGPETPERPGREREKRPRLKDTEQREKPG